MSSILKKTIYRRSVIFLVLNNFKQNYLLQNIFYSNFKPNLTMYDWNNLPKPNVIFVLGGPGSGKGTMCNLITQVCGLF